MSDPLYPQTPSEARTEGLERDLTCDVCGRVLTEEEMLDPDVLVGLCSECSAIEKGAGRE